MRRLTIFAALLGALIASEPTAFSADPTPSNSERPNILLIMADDMGWSDIGCYGGEIPTPNIDALASGGLRFTQFYNTARCSPTRAALLTGLLQHQTGMGILGEDPNQEAPADASPGYTRFLNANCVTIAEVLKSAGYHTFMAGKWHLGYHAEEKWPRQRGFDRFYGIIAGASSYLRPTDPRGLTLDNTPLPPPDDENYYTTDAFAEYLIEFINQPRDNAPFFGYLAFNAPHWPLQARESDIAKFVGKYAGGWDKLREARWTKQLELGVVEKKWGLSPRDDGARPWDTLTDQQKKELDYRMAVYAAQVHRMDYQIGRVIQSLRESNSLSNTLVIFLSDNGACAEPYNDLGGGALEDINNPQKSGAISYGTAWANASNTPFRRYKAKLHEGGIATPLVIHWPAGLKCEPGSLADSRGFVSDIMPTLLELSGAKYPAEVNGHAITPLYGQSLVPVIAGETAPQSEWMFWEHYNDRAARKGDWKILGNAKSEEWELYELHSDRTEQHNVAAEHPELVSEMATAWQQWAEKHNVLSRFLGTQDEKPKKKKQK
jgi:arylsulfatase